MAVALGMLRIDPRVFWAMTLPELQAVLGAGLSAGTGVGAMARADLDMLMRQFPDR